MKCGAVALTVEAVARHVVHGGDCCVLFCSWPVQGIWPPFADGTDVNSVHRSPDNRLLATADDFGRVKLFR